MVWNFPNNEVQHGEDHIDVEGRFVPLNTLEITSEISSISCSSIWILMGARVAQGPYDAAADIGSVTDLPYGWNDLPGSATNRSDLPWGANNSGSAAPLSAN